MSIEHLLSSLMAEAGSLDHLQWRLTESAEQLNKSETYLRVAQLIMEMLRQQQTVSASQPRQLVDRFQLRHALMQVLNPLKAKLILFALWHHYTYPQNPFKTSTVGQFSLDELLRKVMQCYPSMVSLEVGLRAIEPLLSEIEAQEIVQLAETLKAVLRPYLPSTQLFPVADLDELTTSQESLCTILMAPNRCQDLTLLEES